MKISVFLLMFSALTIEIVRSVDTYLNFTTGISLTNGIKEVVPKTVSTTEYVFILYTNNTIVIYNNQLGYAGRVYYALGNRNLKTFDVFSRGVGYVYYYGIVEGGN